MKKKVSFSILGLGRVIEKRIAHMFKSELKNCFVKSVYDKDRKKVKKFEKIFNCEGNKSLINFLNIESDYVYIATESGNHFDHILKCFKHNKNVIVEKPPVLRIKDLKSLQKTAEKKKLKFYTVFQNRENTSVNYVKNLLKNEKVIFVNLSLVWSRFQNYYNDWHGNWKTDGGVLAQQGIHYIDLLIYLFGQPLKCISSISNKVNKLQAEDTHSSLIIFKKNEISCNVNMSTAFRPVDYEASISIYCKDKIITLKGLCCNEVSVHKLKSKKRSSIIKKFSQKVPSGYGVSHKKVFQKIIDKELKKSGTTPLKASETIGTIKLINMMYISFFKKRWVYFKEKNLISKLGN